ncbi:MAG: carboxypeptidase regulatory-like domain-containing protein, partial [Propionibacteriaceae bacterium]|nr:carboxypeptidase regulatory-like domain-containing protein [Propionibacteriaceae bacterium]
VGDYAWIDATGNGQQDAGETPVPTMPVALVGADGVTLATTTTDKNGYYLFDLVPPGTYQVVFTLPDGYLWTAANQGAVQTDSDARGESAYAATAGSAPFTLAVGGPNVVAATDASVPTTYTVKAPYVNPTLDAGVVPVAPQIDIAKWVCKTGTGCVEPSGGAMASLSLATASAGWVKATTVGYNTSADWMILVQNTGNVTLAHVDLIVENFDAGGGRFTNENCGLTTADVTLQPGQFMAVYCTISHVTNMAALGSGKDIINTAQAGGTPVKPGGKPILKPTGETWGKVVTKLATAEVNAKPPYQVKGGGYTTAAGGTTVGSLLAFGLILLGIGVYTRRRRRA